MEPDTPKTPPAASSAPEPGAPRRAKRPAGWRAVMRARREEVAAGGAGAALASRATGNANAITLDGILITASKSLTNKAQVMWRFTFLIQSNFADYADVDTKEIGRRIAPGHFEIAVCTKRLSKNRSHHANAMREYDRTFTRTYPLLSGQLINIVTFDDTLRMRDPAAVLRLPATARVVGFSIDEKPENEKRPGMSFTCSAVEVESSTAAARASVYQSLSGGTRPYTVAPHTPLPDAARIESMMIDKCAKTPGWSEGTDRIDRKALDAAVRTEWRSRMPTEERALLDRAYTHVVATDTRPTDAELDEAADAKRPVAWCTVVEPDPTRPFGYLKDAKIKGAPQVWQNMTSVSLICQQQTADGSSHLAATHIKFTARGMGELLGTRNEEAIRRLGPNIGDMRYVIEGSIDPRSTLGLRCNQSAAGNGGVDAALCLWGNTVIGDFVGHLQRNCIEVTFAYAYGARERFLDTWRQTTESGPLYLTDSADDVQNLSERAAPLPARGTHTVGDTWTPEEFSKHRFFTQTDLRLTPLNKLVLAGWIKEHGRAETASRMSRLLENPNLSVLDDELTRMQLNTDATRCEIVFAVPTSLCTAEPAATETEVASAARSAKTPRPSARITVAESDGGSSDEEEEEDEDSAASAAAAHRAAAKSARVQPAGSSHSSTKQRKEQRANTASGGAAKKRRVVAK